MRLISAYIAWTGEDARHSMFQANAISSLSVQAQVLPAGSDAPPRPLPAPQRSHYPLKPARWLAKLCPLTARVPNRVRPSHATALRNRTRGRLLERPKPMWSRFRGLSFADAHSPAAPEQKLR